MWNDLEGESSEKATSTDNQGHSGRKVPRLWGYGEEFPHPHLWEGGMSIIGMLLSGEPQYPPETGWERFSNSMLEGDWDHAEWGTTINRAESMGFTVEQKDGTIYMWKNKNCNGRFMTAKGGHKIAQQFLDSVR